MGRWSWARLGEGSRHGAEGKEQVAVRAFDTGILSHVRIHTSVVSIVVSHQDLTLQTEGGCTMMGGLCFIPCCGGLFILSHQSISQEIVSFPFLQSARSKFSKLSLSPSPHSWGLVPLQAPNSSENPPGIFRHGSGIKRVCDRGALRVWWRKVEGLRDVVSTASSWGFGTRRLGPCVG